MLQHALLVPDDDLGGVQIDQLLETVVPVDQPAVQIVQVAGGEVARVQQDQGTQVRGDDRNHIQHHPIGLIVRVPQHLNGAQPLDDVLHTLLRARGLEFLTKLLGDAGQIELTQDLLDALGAHLGLELAAVLGTVLAVLFLGQELVGFEGSIPRVHNHVVLEVNHPLKARNLDTEQVAQATGHSLEEPDVSHWRSQVHVPHATPAHATVGDHDTTLVTDNALVLDALVLAAEAFPVLFGTKDAFAEKAIALGAIGAVVDGLGLLNFAVRPRTDVFGGCQRDGHAAVVVDPAVLDFFHGRFPC